MYYHDPLGAHGGVQSGVDRAAALAFDHIILPPPFAPAADGDRFAAVDMSRSDPRLGVEGPINRFLDDYATAAHAKTLRPLIDIVLDHVAADASDIGRVFASTGSRTELDPRHIMVGAHARAIVDTPEDAQRFVVWWADRMNSWARSGIFGFRLLGLSSLPAAMLPDIMRGLRAALPNSMLIGWTHGLAWPVIETLAGTGLDYVTSSLPWWNGTDPWFWQEFEALTKAAPVLMPVETPFAPRLAAAIHDPARLAPAYRRALGLATTLGAAWLMPGGFETADPNAMVATASGRAPAVSAMLDLSDDINRRNRAIGAVPAADRPVLLSGSDAPVLAVMRGDAADPRFATRATLGLVHVGGAARTVAEAGRLLPGAGGFFSRFEAVEGDATFGPGDVLMLAPGESRLFEASRQVIPPPGELTRQAALDASKAPRLAIEAPTPCVDGGRFPAKRIVGELVIVEADVIFDGHEQISVVLQWQGPAETTWHEARMRPLGNDRWTAGLPLDRMGTWRYRIEVWRDAFATFRDELAKKHNASVPTSLELTEGSHLVEAAAVRSAGPLRSDLEAVTALLARGDEASRRETLLAAETAALMARADDRPHRETSAPIPIEAERTAAAFASWYEIFPRSMSDDANRHGTFADVERHLPRIRAMGFDVLYFPPIHPIGKTNRKGRNNSLRADPSDPGSPYAIGAAEGGHDALHPELGTFEDFQHLRRAAAEHGLELAIDFAIQCSPDHPWLRDHKDWFAWRPDGSLRYAENPPKKYEDIVNVDFYAPGAVPDLWIALTNVVLFWAEQGVRLFRVDNPHTKPFPFWEFLIREVRARYPDAIFLAEAFTRPKVMYRLAKIGFSQSYTYFTWRNTPQEFVDYLTELTTTAPRDFFRPHFFVNTPDINPVFLQTSGRPGFLIRAALAATLSGLWGVYNGFELCEGRPVPGKEEYLDSEKYEIRAWDWNRPGNIVADIARLNRIRRDNPALHTHLDVDFLDSGNPTVLCFEKATTDRSNVVMVAISFDPARSQTANLDVPLWKWRRDDASSVIAEDLVQGGVATWTGRRHGVTLTPDAPFAIWRVRAA